MNTAPKRLPKTIPIVTAAALTLGLVAAGMASGVEVGRTTQAQRPGARDATITNRDAMPGSLQRMDRPCLLVRGAHAGLCGGRTGRNGRLTGQM